MFWIVSVLWVAASRSRLGVHEWASDHLQRGFVECSMPSYDRTVGPAHVAGLMDGHWARQAVKAAWYQAIG